MKIESEITRPVVAHFLPATILALAISMNCDRACAEKNLSWLRPKQGLFDLDPRTGFLGYHKWKPTKTPDRAAQLERAGNPHRIAWWARCPNDRHYDGYYIGGGATFGGDRRNIRREGTWGWDYTAPWSRVKLRWFHGRRFQAGEGQYNPDTKNDPLDDFRNP